MLWCVNTRKFKRYFLIRSFNTMCYKYIIKKRKKTNWIFLLFPYFRLFSAASSDSIRFHSNLINQNDNDLRVSIDNTCTDSLVTALDDEALLINDYLNEMAKSKVNLQFLFYLFIKIHVTCTYYFHHSTEFRVFCNFWNVKKSNIYLCTWRSALCIPEAPLKCHETWLWLVLYLYGYIKNLNLELQTKYKCKIQTQKLRQKENKKIIKKHTHTHRHTKREIRIKKIKILIYNSWYSNYMTFHPLINISL